MMLQDSSKLADEIKAAMLAPKTRSTQSRIRSDVDPFVDLHDAVIAGPSPGDLVKTSMRASKDGFWIACRACGAKFESKGMAFCAACMELPAEERRTTRPVGKQCAAPGCTNVIAPSARADARYCSAACKKRALRDRLKGDKTDAADADTADVEMSPDSTEKSEQNQGSKIEDSKMVGRSLDPDRLKALLAQIEDTPSGVMPDIPDFLKRG